MFDCNAAALNVTQIKLAVLNYALGLVCVMPSDVLSNSSDTRLAVSRFITWASEPKSPDVRKVKLIFHLGTIHVLHIKLKCSL
jgi:hypothetical protein